MPGLSLRSSGTSVAAPPLDRIASSSSSSPPTVRATATTCAPASARAIAAARPMPRDAPVTSAIRSVGDGTALADLGEQRELTHVVAALAVGQPRRVSAGKAGVAELRRLGAPLCLADGTVESV